MIPCLHNWCLPFLFWMKMVVVYQLPVQIYHYFLLWLWKENSISSPKNIPWLLRWQLINTPWFSLCGTAGIYFCTYWTIITIKLYGPHLRCVSDHHKFSSYYEQLTLARHQVNIFVIAHNLCHKVVARVCNLINIVHNMFSLNILWWISVIYFIYEEKPLSHPLF